MVGLGFMVTVTLAVPVHPFASVPVTLNKPEFEAVMLGVIMPLFQT
jgi:hypothetical protein